MHSDGEIFLTVGVVALSVPLGGEEDAGLPSVTYVPAKPVARMSMTPQRLDELVEVLAQLRQMYETDLRREDGAGQ